MGKKISVIIPTYNRIHSLPSSVSSVLNQTFSDLELLIVDDGSTDGTDDYINGLSDKRIRYIKANHKGASAARNLGIRNAKNDLIAFQDSDSIWHLDKLQKQYDILQENPTYDAVYCQFKIIQSQNSNTITIPRDDFPDNECMGRLLFIQLLTHNIIGAPTLLIQKKVFENIGYFDESLPALEDYELVLRIAENYNIAYCHEILVDDIQTIGSLSSNDANYFVVRCHLIAKYINELTKYNLLNPVVSRLLEQADENNLREYIGNLLIRMLEKRSN